MVGAINSVHPETQHFFLTEGVLISDRDNNACRDEQGDWLCA